MNAVRHSLVVSLLVWLVACGGSDDDDGPLRLLTHDSFVVSDAVLDAFTAETGVEVAIISSGDAGVMVNQAVLTKGDPVGDVMFGVDNTLLTRALDAELFVPYESPALANVDPRFHLDDQNRVTPVDHGEVCVNFDKSAYDGPDEPLPPASLADLTGPAYRSQLVVENPATSSPGLAFLLATVARFGEAGWQDYWRDLRANDVEVANGWEEAYNGSFSGGSGEGDRPMVVSYASSPPAEVVFSDPPVADAPTEVLTDSCFAQVEMAAIMAGTEREEEAGQFIDFLLSKDFQEDMPLSMFVFPVREDAELPRVFIDHAAMPDDPIVIPYEEIGANRERWIAEWTEIVFRG